MEAMEAMEFLSIAMRLPTEIWLAISDQVEDLKDLATLGQACHQLHTLVSPLLYQRAVKAGIHPRALFWGVHFSLPQTVKHILAAGADVNMIWDNLGRTLELKTGCLVPSFDECRHLSSSFHPEASPYDTRPYCSPLHIAAFIGNVEMIQLLLDHGADLKSGSARVCPCFDIHIASVSSRFYYVGRRRTLWWTPHHVAICSGKVAAAELLLSIGDMETFEPHNEICTSHKLTPVHVASISGQRQMLEWLFDSSQPYEVDAVDICGKTPLIHAYMYRHWDCFEYLVHKGADINRANIVFRWNIEEGLQDPRGWEQMFILLDAIKPSRFEDALKLLELGADPVVTEQRDTDGLPLIHALCATPWHILQPLKSRKKENAIYDRHGMAILNHFLDLGLDFRQSAPINKQYRFGPAHTALGYAVGFGNLMAAQRLIEAGADVDGNPEEDLWSPLTYACRLGTDRPMLEIVTLLIDSGASVNRLRNNTEAPLWNLLADNSGSISQSRSGENKTISQVKDLLLSKGSNPGRGTSTGNLKNTSALDTQLWKKNFDEFEYLLSRCAPDAIGDDDILGLWRIAAHIEDPVAVELVIKKDTHGLIAREDPMVLHHLLSMDPVKPELVLLVIDQATDCDHLHDSETPLAYTMRKSSWPLSEKLPIIRRLVKKKASIFQPMDPFKFSSMDQDAPCTPLAVAIQMPQQDFGIVETMLEFQPFKDYPHVDPRPYIMQACTLGNSRALTALIKSADKVPRILSENANDFLHHVLSGIPGRTKTIREVNMAINCLEILIVQIGGTDLTIPPPSTFPDRQTAEERILCLSKSNTESSSESSLESRAVAWCFQQRLAFSNGTISFRKETMALHFQIHMSLTQLGKILADASRSWKLKGG